MKKKLMIGNGAVARGLWEAGCAFVSSYPGTPSTEITECAAEYDEMYAEWAPNEKVALEAALGASVMGGRAFSGMKHVGLNVAADPLFTASYTGVNAGLVVAVADDMGMHSSQNELDSRHYARASKLPMLEPSDSQECLDFTRLAFELSEEYDTPFMLRLSTRVSHSQGLVSLGEREDAPRREYKKDAAKYVMMPSSARGRHVVVEKRMLSLKELSEKAGLNRIIWGDRNIGIISAGIAYEYAREALGDDASYLKLGMIYPLPDALIREFAAGVEKLYVIEELDPFIEEHCRALGVNCEGKALFSLLGEYSPEIIRSRLLGAPLPEAVAFDAPARPPVLCPGCPHRGLFSVLSRLKIMVSGDIGCYTLGAVAPLTALDTTVCMGASISMLHGMNRTDPDGAKKRVAVIGDSTFIHSGITGLIDIVYNNSPSTVLILDNSITGMTGHQQNPTTGLTLKNLPAHRLDLEGLCKAVGVGRVRTVDPHDMAGFEKALREELAAEEPSVIIAKRPCVLLKHVKKGEPFAVISEKCTKCKACMRIGCPAVRMTESGADIDASICVGCGLCAKMCRFGAIIGEEVAQ